MNMHLINILEKGKYKKYYRYITIDNCGYIVLWKHKPRSGADGYWVYGRAEYIGDILERVVIGDMNSVQENWKEYIWKIQ